MFPRRDDATNKELILTLIDIQGYLSRYGKSHTNWHETLNEVIERLEHVESEPQESKEVPQRMCGMWIPVTERLPEHSGFYIVTAIVTDDGDKLVGLRWYSKEQGWKFGKTPIAWMPLPEPYTSGADMRGTE